MEHFCAVPCFLQQGSSSEKKQKSIVSLKPISYISSTMPLKRVRKHYSSDEINALFRTILQSMENQNEGGAANFIIENSD
jgi:hypothetical protein